MCIDWGSQVFGMDIYFDVSGAYFCFSYLVLKFLAVFFKVLKESFKDLNQLLLPPPTEEGWGVNPLLFVNQEHLTFEIKFL